ncbi:MAG TPA: heavy metal translocating P-type ATPase [Rhodocyclaceae bacterium]
MKHDPSGDCYHCGLPVPASVELSVTLDGAQQPMCCAGCQAVASAIIDNGLADYYRHRDALPNSPREAIPAALDEMRLFDHAAVQKTLVRDLGDDAREVSLMLEGITCAACVWLNEQHLARVPGVTAVSINYATRRARVQWDSRRCALSDILAAVAAIGYRAHPYDVSRHEAIAGRERREAIWRLFVAGFGAMQVMMYAIPTYVAADGEMTEDIRQLMHWAGLILTLPVMAYSARPFFTNALRDLRLRRLGMDVPVALGLGVAFAASVWATVSAHGAVYFDSVSMFVFLLLGGRFLEMRARQKAVAIGESIARLVPALASRIPGWPATREPQTVAAAELVAGDFVLVKAGETVAADGVLVEGVSSFDESLLTGESLPRARAVGESLTAGTCNVDSPVVFRVEQGGDETRLATIVRLMERAASERPAIVALADRVASWFVFTMLCIAALVFYYWFGVDPERAIWVTVSVLVATCPCALSLATPVALTVANGTLAQQGLVVSRAGSVEALAQATRIVFDKTGTLTTGRPGLERVDVLAGDDDKTCLTLAARLEAASAHPLARALRDAATRHGAAGGQMAENILVAPGQGLEGSVDGRRLRIGRPDYVAGLHGRPLTPAMSDAAAGAASLVALGDTQGWIALFVLRDELRPGAANAIAALRKMGYRLAILSGDHASAVEAVAGSLAIREWHAGKLPAEKLERVRRWQSDGERVLMIGDGINDGPVLAQAQVSIAMGAGAQLAKVQADCILIGDDLDSLVGCLRTARRARRVIAQNLAWALAYNALVIPFAALGWVTPWMAGIGMSGSSLVVVANALRIARPLRGRSVRGLDSANGTSSVLTAATPEA